METGRDLLGWGMGIVWEWEWYWVFHRTSCTSLCFLNKYLFPRTVAVVVAVADGGRIYFCHPFCLWCALSNRKFKKQIATEKQKERNRSSIHNSHSIVTRTTDGLPLIFYWFFEIRFMPLQRFLKHLKVRKDQSEFQLIVSPGFPLSGFSGLTSVWPKAKSI